MSTRETIPDGITAENQKRWERVRERLRAELGDAVYNSWFTRLELDAVRPDALHLSVPTKFLKSWVQSHYAARIKARAAIEFDKIDRVVIDVRSTARKSRQRDALSERDEATPSRNGQDKSQPLAFLSAADSVEPTTAPKRSSRSARTDADALIGSPLDRRLSFSTFLVGPSNQLAYAAACRVAEARPGDTPLFNPLYAHASVGLGKTHLLQALAHATNDNRRRAVYLTAERFMSGFVSSLTTQTSIAFKERLRDIDMLIIDDVQFLQGKSIQQEFCHTINALIDAGRQVVVAADRPPSDLETLDERVLSRFKGGLCVDIGPLDEALRVKILNARIAAAQDTQPGFHVPPEAVISYVARTIVTNGRDLEGAVNRLLAHVTLNGAPLTVETAEIADPRSGAHAGAQARQDRRYPEARRLALQHFARRHPVLAPHRQCRAAAPDRHVSVEDADPAVAAGNRAPFRRSRPHHRAACGAQDRGTRLQGQEPCRSDRSPEENPRRTVGAPRALRGEKATKRSRV